MGEHDGTQRGRAIPYLLYEDAPAAIEWLERSFGFREVMRFAPEGVITHAEVELDGGLVMLANPGPDYVAPRRSGQVTSVTLFYVDDVDAHHRRAAEAGAEITQGPEDQPYGDRTYKATDLEGQRWIFAQHVRDVPNWWEQVAAES